MNIELLKHVLTLSQQMAETKDLDQLLTLAMEQTLDVVGAELCYLILLTPDGGLDFRAWSSSNRVIDVKGTGDLLSRSIFNKVIKTGEPIVVSDAMADNRLTKTSSITGLRIRSVMCVPLIARGEVLGAIYVENRTLAGAFRDEDLEPLILFANQAAVSIENAMIITNLEERVAARTAEVEKSWSEAVEANRMRTIFLAQLAHDMRTSATVMQMSFDLLRNPKHSSLDDRQNEWVSRSLMALHQMTQLIQNVFDLSKHELQSLEINRQPVDLSEFLTQMCEIAKGLPWDEGIEFRPELPAFLPTLNIDPVRTQQIIMNLISNALKFTSQGEVVLYAAIERGYVRIGVKDTGEGIPEDAHDTIFERFHQADTKSSRRVKGSGLGLAICRDLVDMHGGRIWLVSSTPDQGSNFAFSLPLAD